MPFDEAATAFRELAAVIKSLRTPGTGCPWDLEQTHKTLRPFLVEEAYEVLDAIDGANDGALREELGDLLLQVVLHAQIADDRGAFAITEVVRGIADKMVRRHPHVFGTTQVSGSAEVLRNWDEIKAAEERDKGGDLSRPSSLDRLPRGLPALQRAQRLGEKAAKQHGQDLTAAEFLAKARAGLTDLEDALQTGGQREEDMGELLFNLCQLARRLGLSAEDSLRGAANRFRDQIDNEAKEPRTQRSGVSG